MNRPAQISYGVMVAMLLAVAFMGLATPLLTVLFALFALNVFNFKGRSKSFAIALFLVTVGAIGLAATFFALETVSAAPKLADRLVPKVVEYARMHEVDLPFKDVQSLMQLIRDEVLERFGFWAALAPACCGRRPLWSSASSWPSACLRTQPSSSTARSTR